MGHVYRELPAFRGLYRIGRPGPPTLVVVHCTEGATAEGAARWFQNPRAQGSAHVCVDDEVVFRCIADSNTAFHAIGVNEIGLGLEIAGFARWSRDEWLAHSPRVLEAARIHAGWNRLYGIPLVESFTRGYHSHAGLPRNDHTDPGAGFPWDVYLQAVRDFMAGSEPAPERKYGRSLRVVFPNGRRFGGWTKDEVPKGWDGTGLGALQWIAKQRPSRIEPGTRIYWKGGRFDDAPRLVMVAKTILNRSTR